MQVLDVPELECRKDWLRARLPDQKAARRREILEAAYRLFLDLEYEAVSLNAIAREAGLSKSSVYLYFQTREDIFLDIFMDAFRDWFAVVRRALDRLDAAAGPAQVAAVWVSTTWRHDRMRALAPLLATSIERHVSDDRLAECMRMKVEECGALQKTLARFLPALKEGDILDLMVYVLSLFAQFVAYERNEGLERVRACPEFNAARWNYETMVTHAVTLLLEDRVR